MSFTKKEREELKELSKQVFGSTSWWQNKLNKRYPLDTFEQLKTRILAIQENSQKLLKEIKEKNTIDDTSISLDVKLTLSPDTPVIPDGSN